MGFFAGGRQAETGRHANAPAEWDTFFTFWACKNPKTAEAVFQIYLRERGIRIAQIAQGQRSRTLLDVERPLASGAWTNFPGYRRVF